MNAKGLQDLPDQHGHPCSIRTIRKVPGPTIGPSVAIDSRGDGAALPPDCQRESRLSRVDIQEVNKPHSSPLLDNLVAQLQYFSHGLLTLGRSPFQKRSLSDSGPHGHLQSLSYDMKDIGDCFLQPPTPPIELPGQTVWETSIHKVGDCQDPLVDNCLLYRDSSGIHNLISFQVDEGMEPSHSEVLV